MNRNTNNSHTSSLLILMALEWSLFYAALFIVIGAGLIEEGIIQEFRNGSQSASLFALAFSIVMLISMRVVGLYSKKLTTYFSDTMIKIFQGFFISISITLIASHLPVALDMNFWMLSSTFLVSFIGMLFTRTLYQKVINQEALNSKPIVFDHQKNVKVG